MVLHVPVIVKPTTTAPIEDKQWYLKFLLILNKWTYTYWHKQTKFMPVQYLLVHCVGENATSADSLKKHHHYCREIDTIGVSLKSQLQRFRYIDTLLLYVKPSPPYVCYCFSPQMPEFSVVPVTALRNWPQYLALVGRPAFCLLHWPSVSWI